MTHVQKFWTQKAIRLSKIAESAGSRSSAFSTPTCSGSAALEGRINKTHRDARLCVRREKIISGGADRDRTDDLRLAKPALSQLSYSPTKDREDHPARAFGYRQSCCRPYCRYSRRHSRTPLAPEDLQSPKVVGLGGFEPPTSRLSGGRSNQLSYRPAPTLPGLQRASTTMLRSPKTE